MITVGVDTYIDLVSARAYALEQGLVLPTDDTDAETLLKRATRALDRRFGNQYIGTKSTYNQPLLWPRDVSTGGYRGVGEAYNGTVDSDGNPRVFGATLPVELGQAQVELAQFIDAGSDPLARSDTPITEKSVTVDVITKTEKYAVPSSTPLFNSVLVILRPLLKKKAGLTMTRGA